MNKRPVLSIVIPMHNEESNASLLLEQIVVTLTDKIIYEIIVVDDGSNDSTQTVLQELLAGYETLRVLQHKFQVGQSAALVSGVCAAKSDWILTMDGDGQNDPKDIIRLLKARDERDYRGGLLFFAGHRKHRKDNAYKRIQSRIANFVRRQLLQDDTPDTGCGLKLFERSLFLSLPVFDHMHRFLPALALRAGATITSIDVNHRQRNSGSSHYGMWGRLWSGLYDLIGVMWLKHRSISTDVVEIKKQQR